MEKLDGKAAVVSGGEEKSVAMMHSTYNAPTPTVALPPALANMNNNVLDDAIPEEAGRPRHLLCVCALSGDWTADGQG